MPVVVFRSTSVSNRPDTCDSLHVTNLALDVVSIAAMHANTSLEVLHSYLMLCIYLAAHHYYGQSRGSYVY